MVGSQSTINELADRVEKMLPDMMGRKNAMHTRNISARLGLDIAKSDRQVRKVMKTLLIERGLPVISTRKGFFLARNKQELKEYMWSLEEHVKGMRQTYDAVGKCLDNEFLFSS